MFVVYVCPCIPSVSLGNPPSSPFFLLSPASRSRSVRFFLLRQSSSVLGFRAPRLLSPSAISHTTRCDLTVRARRTSESHCSTGGEGLSDRLVTRPHHRYNTTIRQREGMSDHRVTLPHVGRGYVGPPCHTAPSPRTTRQVRVCRTSESHCPTGGEGTSDHRVTLPRPLFVHSYAQRLHWVFALLLPALV